MRVLILRIGLGLALALLVLESASAKGAPTANETLKVKAWVTPAVIHFKSHVTLFGKTQAGARCKAAVQFPARFTSMDFATIRTDKKGMVSFEWHPWTKAKTGYATVSCSLHGQKASATVQLKVTA